MFFYAQIDAAGRCIAVSQLAGEVHSPVLIRIDADRQELLGHVWTGTGWLSPTAAADHRPRLVITNLTTDDAEAIIGPAEITVHAGAHITTTVEMRTPDGAAVLPLHDTFRLPIVARDGRERVLLASFTAGVASIQGQFSESGVWNVSEAQINADLPPEQHMAFGGLRIYVIQ